LHRIVLLGVAAGLIGWGTVAAQAERARDIVAYDDVRIEVIAEGAGPLIVMLPGRGRGSEDFDAVAAGLAKAGFRVLRPQPRGAGQSSGPMKNLTLHDFARDAAEVIRHERAGPAVMV
jgi:pimeloyl-ACP methyl ester carboxylesterase